MIKAAGVLFVTKANRALFLKRGPGGDYPGMWCFPGGKSEGEETDIQTAEREAKEEIGSLPKGERSYLTRSISAGQGNAALSSNGTVNPTAGPVTPLPGSAAVGEEVDFTTFKQIVDEEFAVTVDGEHVGFAWAPIDQPPQPMHPGCQIALDRLNMDELGVARAIMEGRLTSPQRYANVTLWNMRVTGTGYSYRSAKRNDKGKVIREAEFVYRRPEHYLTDEFLARCAGLTVIMMHPKKSVMDSDEFNARAVGAVMLPYIKGDEVWSVAKVYDDVANRLLASYPMSTSPAVVLSGSGDQKITTEDGRNIIVEGKPSLLDHLAICEHGVWDKGGEPNGIINSTATREDSETMADTEAEIKAKKDAEDKAKADADAGVLLDKVLSKMDAISTRLDAMEEDKKVADKAKKDAEDKDKEKAEQLAADKAKKDAEEAEEKTKADKAKKDAEEEDKKKADAASVSALTKRIDEMSTLLPKAMTDADFSAMADAQARADAVYSVFGKSAPRFMQGESHLAYRLRLAGEMKSHSPDWKDVDLSKLAVADSNALAIAETRIYADALAAAMHPTSVPANELRCVTTRDQAGHSINTWYGRPGTWMSDFGGGRAAVNRFITNPNHEGK